MCGSVSSSDPVSIGVNDPQSPPGWPGLQPVPAVSSKPVVAYNGGCYFAAAPIDNAPITWANAFFQWGIGTKGDSPGILFPANVVNGAIPNTGTNLSATYGPATVSPQSVDAWGSSSPSPTATMADMRQTRRALLAGIAQR